MLHGAATFLAVDLGAESGRVLSGVFDGERVSLSENHRFPNTPVRLPDGLLWDALRLFREVQDGLARAARDAAGQPLGLGIDSWAVDYGLLDRTGALLGNPFHYRDPRTDGMMERAFAVAPRAELYATTGIQFLPFNTLYQLLAMRDSPQLEAAHTLLMIPDLLSYWLCGEQRGEHTNASTTQLYDAAARGWSSELIERVGLPGRIFPQLVEPGTELGPLLPAVADEVGVRLPVTAVASHDTASAVVGVPAEGDDFAYISSGTWSLVGVETARPVLTPEAMEANFTNEGGYGGTNRFLKNVMGLWLLQECRRTWARQGRELGYDELAAAAEAAPPFRVLLDPDHPSFLPPGDMPERIRAYCRETGQAPPEAPGEYARCIFESLALKYRWVLERAGQLSGQPIAEVHVVGGGANNALLCRLTAEATGLPVLAGPVEATALGNVLVQAASRRMVGDLAQIRRVVRASTELREYEPGGAAERWEEAWDRFQGLLNEQQPTTA